MSRSGPLLWLFGLAFLFAFDAAAGTLTIRYEFTGGQLQGLFENPTNVTGGTMQIQIQADGPGTPVNGGTALLQSFDVQGSSNRLQLVNQPTGSFSTFYGAFSFAYFPGRITVRSGSALSNLGTNVPASHSLALHNLSGTLSGGRYFSPGPFGQTTEYYVRVGYTVQEVSRTFVPEPGRGGFTLLGLALGVGILLSSRWPRR